MATGTLELYRTLIPAHANVAPAVISTFLELASSQHSAAAFGVQFAAAMVYYAAHQIEKTPGLGPALSSEVAPVTSQTDGDVTRQYTMPTIMDPDRKAQWLSTTTYGQSYLAIVATLAASKPITLGAGWCP